MRIIINGAGIAGPTLAYWLRKAGHEVLVIEEAPQLRRGGYVIDFGLVGYDIAEKMGLIPRLRELGYQVRETRFVDRQGRTSASILTDSLARLTRGRYITLRRSDLAATIYDALNGRSRRSSATPLRVSRRRRWSSSSAANCGIRSSSPTMGTDDHEKVRFSHNVLARPRWHHPRRR
jgi:2-polyprenyl-6-methoxyphenol hydroxylase-like FAD-dependent oxidoreductase